MSREMMNGLHWWGWSQAVTLRMSLVKLEAGVDVDDYWLLEKKIKEKNRVAYFGMADCVTPGCAPSAVELVWVYVEAVSGSGFPRWSVGIEVLV